MQTIENYNFRPLRGQFAKQIGVTKTIRSQKCPDQGRQERLNGLEMPSNQTMHQSSPILPTSVNGYVMQDYRNQRGESALLVVAIVAGIGIAWFVFVAVKDWIRDSKDRRDHPEKYQKIERQLDGPHEPAGYSITFYP